jgi:tripartite-type tricarboxylate transporter receptor subunit TctC
MKSVIRIIAVAVACSGSLLQTAAAQATWPSRPVTLVVPFAAGGSTDITARQLAEGLRAELGQTVVIDNKAGAGGNIGAALVANAQPDGYTLLMATNAHAASPALYKKLQYSFRKDLVPAAQVVSFPNVLAVRADFPAKTLKEFADYVKAGKGPLNYGSAGNGSSQHLSTALLNNMLQGKMTHVPYKGGAPATAALMAGDIQTLVSPLIEVLPYIKSGHLRALGITTREPSPLLPGVPTIAEELPGYEVSMWSGILVPAGTPAPVVRKLNAAVRKVLNNPEMARKLSEQGYRAFDEPPEALGPMYDKEVERWGNMVRISGARVD